MIAGIAAFCALLSLVPAAMFLRNLSFYRPLPKHSKTGASISVLIPVRNEEKRVETAVRSILACRDVDLEVIVLDDDSTDSTAEIVRQISAQNPHVRLEATARLPNDWCGKNFACHQLAALARHPILVFIDADVRITSSDALARLAQSLDDTGAALLSGFPREETGTFAERLVIPLIHFVLLGFLPLGRKGTRGPRFAAACGQLIVVRRDAYNRCGGHASIASTLHDGIMLARRFRAHGFATGLFDGTDTFACRMYERAGEVWNGFLKNAHEGLGSRRLIALSTLFLLGGQVLPFCLLVVASNHLTVALAGLGAVAALMPRLVGVIRFRQSFLGAMLHPFGVCLLLAIQWCALIGSLAHRPVEWKNRSYVPLPVR